WAEADAAEAEGRPVPAQLQDRAYLTENTLVRAPDGGEWVPKSSDRARAIVAVMASKCENGSFPKTCDPAD
ncbi:MAG: hypothetical protein KDB69_05245, partial [Acidimicrobiia bacterium]|nr:hypothetical protein [Acidimicrobiia bacterium]